MIVECLEGHRSEHDGHHMLVDLRSSARDSRWLHNYDVTYVPRVVGANIFPRPLICKVFYTHYLTYDLFAESLGYFPRVYHLNHPHNDEHNLDHHGKHVSVKKSSNFGIACPPVRSHPFKESFTVTALYNSSH